MRSRCRKELHRVVIAPLYAPIIRVALLLNSALHDEADDKAVDGNDTCIRTSKHTHTRRENIPAIMTGMIDFIMSSGRITAIALMPTDDLAVP